MWFGEIAAHFGDRTSMDVKGTCHREYGLTIRLRNEQFAWVWKQTGERLTYEQQCKLLGSGVLGVSSGMTTKELSEYLDAMGRDYRAQGVVLTQPEERK
jgi:hypothetical protein